jgi:Transposase DDE domain
VDKPNVARRPVAETLSGILDSPEITRLVESLEQTRWTGRPGYPTRALIGMALAKSMYAIPTWTRTVALVREHPALAAVIAPDGEVPSHWACYRFAGKLTTHRPLLDGCIASVVRALKQRDPDLGNDVAIDASDMPAYARGVKADEPETGGCSDPDASWGYRSSISTRASGIYFGYKLHMAACSKTDLPLAWRVETGKANESTKVAPLLDKLHTLGIDPATCAMDKGYDHRRVYQECAERNVLPVVPLRNTRDVKIGAHFPPFCKHGDWRFAGADHKRGATKWRCPTGECTPASVWVKATRLQPLIPRSTPRWKTLYRGRGSVEREFGRLKHEWALAPLRVRGLERVRLHADLTILAQLSSALNRSKETALAA